MFSFVFGSFARVGMFGFGKQYPYPYQEYTYWANEHDDDYPLTGGDDVRETVPGLFEIWYGVRTWPNLREIIEPDGEQILLNGPPFTFQIYFFEMKNNISRIHFNRLNLIGETWHDILKSEDIYLSKGYAARSGYEEREDSDYGDTRVIEVFRQDNSIDFLPLFEAARNTLKKREYSFGYLTEEGITQKLDDGTLSSIIRFENLPINFKEEKEITIQFDIDVVMTNGEINNLQFENVYKRQSRESTYSYWIAPESFGKKEK
jgi:hypothetical protein